MNKQTTLKTDALVTCFKSADDPRQKQLEAEVLEQARLLGMSAEREANLIAQLDEARTELEMWRDGNIMHEIHRDELEKAERERDEALEELQIVTRQREELVFHYGYSKGQIADLVEVRDELREMLDDMAHMLDYALAEWRDGCGHNRGDVYHSCIELLDKYKRRYR